MSVAFFSVEQTDLAARKSASALRASVEQALSEEGAATLDLSKVLSLSESYADELFGVLVRDRGLQVLTDLKLRGARPEVLRSVISAVRYRALGGSKESAALTEVTSFVRQLLDQRSRQAEATVRPA